MTKEQENEAIKDHHLPIRIKELEAHIVTLTEAFESSQETLRDRFAMAALTGILANPHHCGCSTSGGGAKLPSDAAYQSYRMANAMFRAR